jgi:hypothetical protein
MVRYSNFSASHNYLDIALLQIASDKWCRFYCRGGGDRGGYKASRAVPIFVTNFQALISV